MGILVSLLIGALAGYIGGRIMGKGMGLLVCIIVGIVGGLLGSWVFSILGLSASGSFWGQLLVGIVGAVLLLWILSLFRKKYASVSCVPRRHWLVIKKRDGRTVAVGPSLVVTNETFSSSRAGRTFFIPSRSCACPAGKHRRGW